MNRLRYLAIGTTLIASLAAPAQQTASGPTINDSDTHGQRAAQSGVPSVELQLKVLTEKLDLTRDQQARMTPILKELHDATLKIVEDASLSNEQRLEMVRPHRYKARDQMRAILSDDQKAKLDDYLAGPHTEMHGSLTGTAAPQR
jgi:Spy/CpxP family protein refolding chaperone